MCHILHKNDLEAYKDKKCPAFAVDFFQSSWMIGCLNFIETITTLTKNRLSKVLNSILKKKKKGGSNTDE